MGELTQVLRRRRRRSSPTSAPAAPALDRRATRALGPVLERGASPAADLARQRRRRGAGPTIVASDPVIRADPRASPNDGAPASKNLHEAARQPAQDERLRVPDRSSIFNSAGAVNGFDQYGHFLRALLPVHNCVDYTSIPQSGCSAKFGAATLSAAAKAKRRVDAHRDRRHSSAADSARDQSSADDGAVETDPQPSAPPETTAPADQTTIPEDGSTEADPSPNQPDAAPDAPISPDGQPQVDAGAARQLLDFLIGERRHHRGGKR